MIPSTYLGKVKFKDLILIFDENDDVLEGIKNAMIENNVSKGSVVEVKGLIKNFTINYFQKGSLKYWQIAEPKEIVKANGEFKIDFAENRLFGRLRIAYKDKGKIFDGILARAKACRDLKIVLRYLETE